MPVQKMSYLGSQVVIRHLAWLQKQTLLTNIAQTEPGKTPFSLHSAEIKYRGNKQTKRKQKYIYR